MFARRIRYRPALLCLLFALLAVVKARAEADVDLAVLDFREGDIVFQHLPGKLSAVIGDVTGSQLTHCGLVVDHKDALHVLEAIGPVRYLPLQKWLKRGERSQFTQMRLKNVSKEQIAKAVKAAETLLGRPYDIQYELDDAKIYCSELVYKGYLRGADIEVGEKQRLGDLNWKGHETFIRALAGGELPLDRVMVTPVSVARSPLLKLVYSTFPVRADEPVYDQTVLAGRWNGEYTIKNQVSAKATFEFDRNGTFSSGRLCLTDGADVAIRALRVDPFESKREFTGRLSDDRGISGDLHARIRDAGRRIIGTWKDDEGNRGVFSFEKEMVESE